MAEPPRPTGSRLFDLRIASGKRHFADLPETYSVDHPEWERIRDAVADLEGAELVGYLTDEVTEAWIDFRLDGHLFSLNNQHGDWWFFVEDPTCPDALLLRVLDHFEALLQPVVARARAAGPLAADAFRVLVYEPDGRVTTRDFPERATAVRYADDAAWESENGVVIAVVFDDALRPVHRGGR